MDAGITLGTYTIVSELGSGDFANTFLVHDPGGAHFALKLARSTTGDVADRLQDEADALQDMDHAGIPPFVESGNHEGRPFLVMGLAPGKTLKEHLDNHSELNRRFSDYETLLVTQGLLEILCYMTTARAAPWVHRDIKAANILVTDSLDRVTLIDFGFCKSEATPGKRYDDSFARAGAARYAPPEKHRHPARAIANHDVFAVGVIAYQMLTGIYPWSAGLDGDDGDLLEAMEHPAIQIESHNNTVRSSVSTFVMRLLELNDSYRPSACQALEECTALMVSSEMRGTTSFGAAIKFDRVWRDPIYGDIRLTSDELAVIGTPEMQRLRGYQQLGLTSLVYEGARHSRLLHSVGCVERVERILTSIEKVEGIRIDPEFRLTARMFALTHDVSHIPLGHTLEDEYRFFSRHDHNNARIRRLVLDPSESSLATLLSSTSVGRETRRYFDADSTVHKRSDITELISGPVGADVLDYIDRDSFFLGLDHKVDSAIDRQLRFHRYSADHNQDSHLISLAHSSYGVRSDRHYALESVYDQRYALFLKAYTHKTKIKAGVLVAKALSICLYEGKRPALSERIVERLPSDELLLVEISGSKRERAARLIDRLRRRELPVAAYRTSLMSEAQQASPNFESSYASISATIEAAYPDMPARMAAEEALAREAGVRADDIFLYVPATAPGLKMIQSHRFLVDPSGRPQAPEDEWFQRLKRKHLGLWDAWVFVDPSVEESGRDRVGAAAENLFARNNQIAEHVRQRRLF